MPDSYSVLFNTVLVSGKPRRRWIVPLSVSHPIVAAYANGWDCSTVTAGSKNIMSWKCYECGFVWLRMIRNLTQSYENNVGGICPKRHWVQQGSISLSNAFPEIAREAYGWDPSIVTSYCKKRLEWLCSFCGFIWGTQVCHRTLSRSGCPSCAGRYQESLAVTHYGLSKESHGWDPKLYTAGSSAHLLWECGICGNCWRATIQQRVRGVSKGLCPVCYCSVGSLLEVDGFRFIVAENAKTLKQVRPQIVNELVHPELAEVVGYGSSAKISWWCSSCKNTWLASVNNRVGHGQGCPRCAKNGFNPSKPSYVYFLKGTRGCVEMLQFGLTSTLEKRLRFHSRNGFTFSAHAKFLFFELGSDALNLESEIKRRLRDANIPSIKSDVSTNDKFPGYVESFRKDELQVSSLEELITFLGITISDSASWVSYI